jgi:diacylglycerol O-acyltransferase
MSDVYYERLTQLDHSFLVYEGPNAPMHVGATQIFEATPLRGPAGGIDFERIEAWVASRLHRIPRYRQRLAWTPVERHPIWIDDPHFQLRYHLRHTRLPGPGSERQLKRTAGRILSQHLDRAKPLWELWVVEGLEQDRFAVVSKVHHCMIDGVSGADLLAELLTPEPVEKPEPPPAWIPRPAPDGVRLARDGVLRTLRTPLDAARAAWHVARDHEGARGRLGERLGALVEGMSAGLAPVPPTPLNQPVGPYRRIDWLPMDLHAVRSTAKALGGTVNDVVLATVAGGVRRFLGRSRGEDLTGLDFRVMAPVSMRAPAEHGRLGNRVAAWIVPLPVAERDAGKRFERVRETTRQLKASKAALASDTLAQVTEWSGPLLFSLGSRLLEYGAPFHMVVTNVPGPRSALHLLQAPMLAAHPMVPLLGTLATGIALFSYRDVLSWGFTADWDLVPDLHDFVRAIDRSFLRLREQAGTAPVPGSS